MKIAIATVEKHTDSDISNRGGRAPYYLIFDEDQNLLETIKNPFTSGGGGAGTGVAKMLSDKGVDYVVVGAVGEKMAEGLKQRGVEFYEKEGSIKDALNFITKK